VSTYALWLADAKILDFCGQYKATLIWVGIKLYVSLMDWLASDRLHHVKTRRNSFTGYIPGESSCQSMSTVRIWRCKNIDCLRLHQRQAGQPTRRGSWLFFHLYQENHWEFPGMDCHTNNYMPRLTFWVFGSTIIRALELSSCVDPLGRHGLRFIFYLHATIFHVFYTFLK
jgi:hypothetical protein